MARWNAHGPVRLRMSVAALGFLATAPFGLLAPPPTAQACGGLFCNARPPDPFAPLPVAQDGENVVFSITKDPAGGAPTLQAHIQILYTGDAEKFSWIVPVDAAPTLSTGTDRLFSALASLTRPVFRPTYETSGTCRGGLPTGAGGAGGAAGGSMAAGSGGSSGSGGGVTVVFQGAVGPFQSAVITSTDPAALKTWLVDNGYVVEDAAAEIIDAYVRENKYFVALKLLNGVGVRSIRPIVLTFRGVEACVPLRLTAIAANPDMPVMVWVLADRRVAPRGFHEMAIDEARIDWLSSGSNYFGPKGLVSQAANEAGGNAFVTEYAGPSMIARGAVYTNGQIDLAVLRAAMTPPVYVQQLIGMGLGNDPLTLPLLAKYIPMPEAVKAMGVTESQFYGNLGFYWGQFAFPAYDLAGLTDEISTAIVTPRIEAQMMIDRHPYLTRLNTFISPEEMTKDPFFFEAADLPDVSNVHRAVIRTMCGEMEYLACNAPMRLELGDGRMVWLRAGSTSSSCQGRPASPTPALAAAPAAVGAWQRETSGEGTRVLDNTTKIAAAIVANNASFPEEERRFPTPTSAGAGGAGGGAGGSGPIGSGGTGGTTPPGSGGVFGGSGTGGMMPAGSGGILGGSGTGGTPVRPSATGNAGGCGCTAGRGAGSGPLSLALGAGLLVMVARRRRR